MLPLLKTIWAVAISMVWLSSAYADEVDECTEGPLFGKNCIVVEYSLSVGTLKEVPRAIGRYNSSLDELAKKQKLKKFILQSSGYSVNPDYSNPNWTHDMFEAGFYDVWKIEGWAKYALPDSDTASQFADFLLSQNHKATVNPVGFSRCGN